MSAWRAAAVLAFAGIGLWRALVLASLLVVDPPVLALVAVAGQAILACVAAVAIARRRAALAKLALAGFFACVVVQMGADAFVYGFSSLLEALAGVVLAAALAVAGWIALRGEPPASVQGTL